MGDPILLPDCPELRARAEAVARERYDRLTDRLDSVEAFDATPVWFQRGNIAAALAELRDLSTPTGRDHACRWLWELLTGEAPEWCPAWSRYDDLGYMLATAWQQDSIIEVLGVVPGGAVYLHRSRKLNCPGVEHMSPAEALAAAIVAALEWRRGQK